MMDRMIVGIPHDELGFPHVQQGVPGAGPMGARKAPVTRAVPARPKMPRGSAPGPEGPEQHMVRDFLGNLVNSGRLGWELGGELPTNR